MREFDGDAKCLKVYIGEADRYQHQPLYEAIVKRARERHMAGATVHRGVLGFGAKSHLHTTKVLALSTDLPLVVEIVDTPEHIEAFLPELDEMMGDGLVTVEDVHVRIYRAEQDLGSGGSKDV